VKLAINFLADHVGWTKLPQSLRSSQALRLFVERGDLNVILIIAKYLYQVVHPPSIADMSLDSLDTSTEQKSSDSIGPIVHKITAKSKIESHDQDKRKPSAPKVVSPRSSSSPKPGSRHMAVDKAQSDKDDEPVLLPQFSKTEPTLSPPKNLRQLTRNRSISPTKAPSGTRRSTSPMIYTSRTYPRHLQCQESSPSSPRSFSPSRSLPRVSPSPRKRGSSSPILSRAITRSPRYQQFVHPPFVHELDARHPLSLQIQYDVLRWIESLQVDISRSGYLSAIAQSLPHQIRQQQSPIATSSSPTRRPRSQRADRNIPAVSQPKMDYADEWCTGVLLSAVLAYSVFRYDKAMVKEITPSSSSARPRLILAGTESVVRSSAQVLRNLRTCLQALQSRHPYHDLDLEVEDFFIQNSYLLWHLLYEIYRSSSSSSRPASTTSSNRHPSPAKSISPSKSYHGQLPVKQTRPLSPSPVTRDSILSPATTHDSSVVSTSSSEVKARTRQSAPLHKKRWVSPSSSIESTSNRNKISSYLRNKKTELERSANTGNRENFSPKRKIHFAKPIIRPSSPVRLRSKSAPIPSYPDHFPINPSQTPSDASAAIATRSSSTTRRQHRARELGLNRANRRRSQAEAQGKVWYPPASDEESSGRSLLPITNAQILAVRLWLNSLQIAPIRDGEGGFFTDISSTAITPLPLSHDRIRNGYLFYELLALFEPRVIAKAEMGKLFHPRPATIAQARDNLARALWLWKLIKSPPLSEILLTQPMQILRGNRQVIWALLYEIMLAYQEASPVNPPPPTTSSTKPKASAYRPLEYSPAHRRQLDLSLISWLFDQDILQRLGHVGPLGLRDALLPANPSPTYPVSTILTYERQLRDGTIFCLLLEESSFRVLINFPRQPWYRSPKTYKQCLSNVSYVVASLRNIPQISRRYLYIGIEEEIVRGHWDGILGLLEDIHRYYDHPDENHGSSRPEQPYLGSFEYLPPTQQIALPRSMRASAVNLQSTNFAIPSLQADPAPLSPSASSSASPKVAINQLYFQSLSDIDLQAVSSYRSNLDVFPRLNPSASRSPTRIRASLSGDESIVEEKSQLESPSRSLSRSPGFTMDSLTKQGSPLNQLFGSTDGPPPVSTPMQSASSSPATSGRKSSLSRSQSPQKYVSGLISPFGLAAPSYQGVIQKEAEEEHRIQKVRRLDSWIAGMRITCPSTFSLLHSSSVTPSEIPGFNDGVKLCEILLKASRLASMPGVTLAPHNKAQRMQNIRHFLEYAGKFAKDLRPSELFIDEDIVEGRAGLQLLHILDRIKATSIRGRYEVGSRSQSTSPLKKAAATSMDSSRFVSPS
jgi:hypothetical protein